MSEPADPPAAPEPSPATGVGIDPAPPVPTPPPAPRDVTDEFRARGVLVGEDENDEDTIWELDGGFVKVKTFYDINSPLGFDFYTVTGSIVDGATGKAMLDASGVPMVYPVPRAITWQADAPGDLQAFLDRERAICVGIVRRAHANVVSAATMKGIGRRPGGAHLLPVAPMSKPPNPNPDDNPELFVTPGQPEEPA